MVLDYSKWDSLELSDDSDVEVHPNVDKRSFIRAKQAQIHQERAARKHQIATLKYERVVNDGLLLRIDRLLSALKAHAVAAAEPNADADKVIFQALVECADPTATGGDEPPKPPEGVHHNVKEKVTYSKMMGALVDQVKREMGEQDKAGKAEEGATTLERVLKGVQGHKDKVTVLQGELLEKLAELEREEKRHITSDDIHTGFDVSHVAKEAEKARTAAPSSSKPTTTTTTELLNPGAVPQPSEQAPSAQDDDVNASPTAKQFAAIPATDYQAQLAFISSHPDLLAERETDGLLVEAFQAQLDGDDGRARTCVHHALLIQYCRQLGRDGVGLFFKRVTTDGHQAYRLFADDVASTHARIRDRAATIRAERERDPDREQREVEQIQLHAVDPGTSIAINVPPPAGATAGAGGGAGDDAAARRARALFESFDSDMRAALESGSLDRVNRVLARMSVDEAEAAVGKLSEGGMLSVEEGVIDATTEEGRRKVEELEKARKGDEVFAEEEDPRLAEDPE
ncbi:Cdc37 N terminal kinase binding-domain-containing protein [Lineolata rhizophorae]|uniref:Hsp90 chaperone protein kinase-targeting subunit n=1 Tax=Lineolata rhizophorae TaxID=578093 RepID=A0A6A6NQ82_9PEZI|nr:Cdc37 N terminal kinase binding-domain-containing protein [Lineolata rhizophorae]